MWGEEAGEEENGRGVKEEEKEERLNGMNRRQFPPATISLDKS